MDEKQDLINEILKDRELLNNIQFFDCNYKARVKGNITDKKAKEYFDIYYDTNNLRDLIRDVKEKRKETRINWVDEKGEPCEINIPEGVI
jgi:hypothetical protein